MATFTVIGGSIAAPPTRVKPISGGSPGTSRQRQNFGGMGTAYRALSPSDQATWQTAANTINMLQARVGRHKLTASNAFNLCNSGRMAINLPLLSTAPQGSELSLPPALSAILVNSTSHAGRFTLTLTARDAGVGNPVQILACAPQVAGKVTWPDKSFAPIGAVPNLTTDATDISAMFAAKYGVPPAGYEICLRLVATSQAGLRRDYLLITGFCAAAAATVSGTDDGEGGLLHAA